MVNYEKSRAERRGTIASSVAPEDSMQRDIAATRSETVVVGRVAGSRPGHSYLAPGANTTDDAAQATREFNRQAAYADGIREMCDAWRGPNRDLYEIARIHDTGDAKRDAYLDSVYDLQNAWHRGTGKR